MFFFILFSQKIYIFIGVQRIVFYVSIYTYTKVIYTKDEVFQIIYSTLIAVFFETNKNNLRVSFIHFFYQNDN